MNWRLFSILFLLHVFCFGQEKSEIDKEYINFDDITRINDLFYFQADTTLVTGRVIHYNKKNQGTKYIHVTNGKPHQLNWVYFNDEIEAPKNSTLGSIVAAAAIVGGIAASANGNNNNFIGNGFRDDYSYLGNQQDDNIVNSYANTLERIELSNNLNSNNNNQKVSSNESAEEQLNVSENIINEIKNGPYETYFNNGQIKVKGNYKNGEKEGLWQKYYENGKLENQVTFSEGRMVGALETYHLNGQLRGRVNYTNGKENGIMEIYHENGYLMIKGLFKDALPIGEWVYFNENGEIIETENFDD